MKRLLSLGVPPAYLDRYTLIRDSKHLATRAQLVAIHQYISAQYEAYRVAVDANALAGLLACQDCHDAHAALRACYDISTKALEQLKKDIKAAQPPRQLKYCPMCGTTLPTTFDHYLPAADFPEFAVLALNLVPCCSQCNSIKDDDWLNAHGGRQYVHAYADEIPDVDILSATLHESPELNGVGVTFDLVRPNGVANDVWELLRTHFERLHLVDRYNELGNDEIAEILADCRIFLNEGGQDARAFLFARAAERRQAHGRSHWRVVLMNAMAADPQFTAWIPD